MVEIFSLGKVEHQLLNDLAREIVKVFEKFVDRCLVSGELDIPPSAYDESRKQYRSDLLLNYLSRETRGGERKTVGLTNVDMYAHPLNFVFGQAQCPGKAAIVSLYRLDPEFYGQKPDYGVLLERAVKEVVHELGHTFGLLHCLNTSCVMSFSNHIGEVDRKSKFFCRECFKALEKITEG